MNSWLCVWKRVGALNEWRVREKEKERRVMEGDARACCCRQMEADGLQVLVLEGWNGWME